MLKLFLKFSIGTWAAALIALITIPIVTRLISPEEFGKASMFTLAYNLLMRIGLLGSDQAFVRSYYEVDPKERTSLLWNALSIPVALFILVGVILGLFSNDVSAFLFESSGHSSAITLLAFTIAIGGVEQFAVNVLRMSKRAIAYSIVQILRSTIYAVVIIAYALAIDRSFYGIIQATLVSQVIVLSGAMWLERDLWFRVAAINWMGVKQSLAYGLPYVPTFILMWLMQAIDRMFLRVYSNLEELGYYFAAFKLIAALSLFKVAFQNFWIPVSLEAYNKDSAKTQIFQTVGRSVIGFSIIGGILLVTGCGMIASLLGQEYSDAATIAPFLIFVPLAGLISEATGRGIGFKRKTYWYAIVSAIAVAINYLGCLILVPVLEARGAAISTGVSYIVYLMLKTRVSQMLYYVDYHFSQLCLSVLILCIVALVYTFHEGVLLQLTASIFALLVVTFLHRDLWKYKGIWRQLYKKAEAPKD